MSHHVPTPRGVLAFGEVLWDLLPSGSVLGGAPANFATRVQSLGVPVTLASRVGQDDLGERAVNQLSDLGLDVRSIQHDAAHPTGTVEVQVDDKGSASYTILTGVAYDFIAATPDLMAAAERCALFYFGTLAQRQSTARSTLATLLAAAPQAVKLLDINLRRDCYDAATVATSLQHADIMKLNDNEVGEVSTLLGLGIDDTPTFCQTVLQEFDMQVCLVTRGAHGVYARSKGGEILEIPGYQVTVVDTIGSGDAFTAAFVWSYLRGATMAESCELGNRMGALVATQRGGMVPVTVQQLMAFPASVPA